MPIVRRCCDPLAIVGKDFGIGPGAQDEVDFREDDAGACPAGWLVRAGRATVTHIEGERLSA